MGKAQELMSAALRMSEKEAVARARGQDFSGKHVKTHHVGQRVLYHGEGADITSRTKSKVVPQWRGPVQITGVVPGGDHAPTRYLLFDNRTGLTKCVGIARLCSLDVSRMPDPPAYNKAGVDADEAYVEAVLGDNGIYTTSKFRVWVRWEGWTSDHDSEEPLKTLDGVRGVRHVDVVKTYIAANNIRLVDDGLAVSEEEEEVSTEGKGARSPAVVVKDVSVGVGQAKAERRAEVVQVEARVVVKEQPIKVTFSSSWRFEVGDLVDWRSATAPWMVADRVVDGEGHLVYELTNVPERGSRKKGEYKVLNKGMAHEHEASRWAALGRRSGRSM